MRAQRAALAGMLTLALAGCVEVDGELAANGSLSFRYKYDPPPHATFKSERTRLSSPFVRVDALERDPATIDGSPSEFAIATIVVDDPAKLSSAPAFAGIRVEADVARGELRVAFPGVGPEGQEHVRSNPEADRQALRLSLLLPGPITRASPEAVIDGRHVTWVLSTRQFAALGDPATLTVAWTAAGAGR
jgi:hypothetical protein